MRLVELATICPECRKGCHWSERLLAYYCFACERYGMRPSLVRRRG